MPLSPLNVAEALINRRISDVVVCGVVDIPDAMDSISLSQLEAYIEIDEVGFVRVFSARNEDGLACEVVPEIRLDRIADVFPDLRPVKASLGSNSLGEGPKKCVSVAYRPGDPRDEGFIGLSLLLENGERLLFEGQWTFGMRIYVIPRAQILSGELYIDLIN